MQADYNFSILIDKGLIFIYDTFCSKPEDEPIASLIVSVTLLASEQV